MNMQKLFRCLIVGGVLAATASAAGAGDLKLTIARGRVTLIATDVPVRQILTEWAQVGKATIVNGEKLGGPPLTLQLIDVPEQQALDTVLRSASGYVAAQRAAFDPAASVFDRIMILPTSRAPVVSASATPPPFTNNNRTMMPQPVDDDEPMQPPMMPPNMTPNGMQPAATAVPAQTPGMPTGAQPLTAPRPGMLPPPPAGQPNPYTTAPPIIRPPGGPGGRGGGPGGER